MLVYFTENFAQAALFCRYGFLATIVLRMVFSIVWNVLYIHQGIWKIYITLDNCVQGWEGIGGVSFATFFLHSFIWIWTRRRRSMGRARWGSSSGSSCR